jgi:mono/diheme cytochrome c family protein
MLKRYFVIVLAATCLAAVSYSQNVNNVVINVTPTSAVNGQQMFSSYCASCHGIDGKGNGSAAYKLPVRPANLTTLAAVNRGKFPSAHVTAAIDEGSDASAQMSSLMPAWGLIFDRMGHFEQFEKVQRETNLTSYIAGLQQK